MASQSAPAPALDVMATLQLAFRLWWREFAPITMLGFVLLTVPALVQQALAPSMGAAGAATVLATLRGVLGTMFAATVGFGTLASIAGRRLDPRAFITTGLAASQPGVVVGLTLGAGLVTVMIVLLIARSLGTVGALVTWVAVATALWGAATLLPAVAAAVAERLSPVAALERAARLTHGNRWRLMGMVMLIGLALLVTNGGVTLLRFGQALDPAKLMAAMMATPLDDPGLWVALLVQLLIAGVLACVPPAVYASLAMRRR